MHVEMTFNPVLMTLTFYNWGLYIQIVVDECLKTPRCALTMCDRWDPSLICASAAMDIYVYYLLACGRGIGQKYSVHKKMSQLKIAMFRVYLDFFVTLTDKKLTKCWKS